jgi:putative FmdB family regulatory protein
MPIYDHLCDHCGHAFSVVRSYSDPPVEQCPNCGKRPRRLIAPPAIVFKGSGWYKTDSRAAPSTTKDGDSAKPGATPPGTEAPASKEGAKPASEKTDHGSRRGDEKKGSGAASKPSSEAAS